MVSRPHPERNKWGQFATPTALALSLARYARTLFGNQAVRFLDPAIGTGSFYSALRSVSARKHRSRARVELDPLFAGAAMELWSDQGLSITQGDFTRQPIPDRRYNLVIANPPYVRHHHLTGEDKDRLKAKLSQSLRLEMSGLAGLYCYFLLLCHDWMEEHGLAIWLIPSEFMDVNYGSTHPALLDGTGNSAPSPSLLPNRRAIYRRTRIFRRRGLSQGSSTARS